MSWPSPGVRRDATAARGGVTPCASSIDILHPAHVHFFRNFHAEMTERGHELHITARDKDRSIELLRAYDLPFEQISTSRAAAPAWPSRWRSGRPG